MLRLGEFKFMRTLVSMVCIFAFWKEAFGADPTALSFDGRLAALQNAIPAIDGFPERGRMVKCREGMIPVMRLDRWASFLVPSNRSEEIKIENLLESNIPELRYVAARAIFIYKGFGRKDTPEDISIYNALQSKDSRGYASLVQFLRQQK